MGGLSHIHTNHRVDFSFHIYFFSVCLFVLFWCRRYHFFTPAPPYFLHILHACPFSGMCLTGPAHGISPGVRPLAGGPLRNITATASGLPSQRPGLALARAARESLWPGVPGNPNCPLHTRRTRRKGWTVGLLA